MTPGAHQFVCVVLAHVIGMLCAYAWLHAFRAMRAPPAGRHLPTSRLLASLSAITMTLLALSVAGIDHRLAVWTAMLITLGVFKGRPREAAAVALTIMFVALVGSGG